MNKSRVEAFTDGIIAIAATLMVVELEFPSTNDWAGLLELRIPITAYIISFAIIFIMWAMHHDLFKKTEYLSKKAFMINGLWIFLITLMPFTTAWAGIAPDETVPVFVYPLDLLLCSFVYQLLEYQISKDNPGAPRDWAARLPVRILMNSGYIACMIFAFIRPKIGMYIIGATAAAMIFWYLAGGKLAGKEKEEPKEKE